MCLRVDTFRRRCPRRRRVFEGRARVTDPLRGSHTHQIPQAYHCHRSAETDGHTTTPSGYCDPARFIFVSYKILLCNCFEIAKTGCEKEFRQDWRSEAAGEQSRS